MGNQGSRPADCRPDLYHQDRGEGANAAYVEIVEGGFVDGCARIAVSAVEEPRVESSGLDCKAVSDCCELGSKSSWKDCLVVVAGMRVGRDRVDMALAADLECAWAAG